MPLATTILLLIVSALLEVGGDALIRMGMRNNRVGIRIGMMLLGAAALAIYGYLVNASPWDFGRLMGVYIVLFFVVAQLTSWLIFHQKPGSGILIGGLFIVVGGIIIAASGQK